MIFQKNTVSKQAFTLVEIVVSATILVILTSIGFYSYTKNISDARDSARISDISALSSQLSLYKRERGAYPFPGSRVNLTNGGTVVVALQGKMDNNVALSTATTLPLDPELDVPYFYSTTPNRQEYQLAASMENSDNYFTYLKGDYRSVAKLILPNILIATDSSTGIDVDILANTDLFLFNQGFNTLPYDFRTGAPYSDGVTTLSQMLVNAGDDYWQNTDYRSCEEIEIAGKNISVTGDNDDIYQILDSNGVLTDTACDGTL